MTKPLILSLDQGTSSSRALLVDASGAIIGEAQNPLHSTYPQPGWVEQDANEIWQTQLEAIEQVLEEAGVEADEVAAIGITNQRETCIVWDRATGEAMAPAIVWQDRRTADFCAEQKSERESMVIERTGLRLDPYFSATKLHWILQDRGIRERAERGELAFGTVDSWLAWKLSGGELHVTDPSNASRTMLMDIDSLAWDEVILKWMEIPRSLLPEIRPHGEVLGFCAESVLGASVPIASQIGDQQASLFGQACHSRGDAKNTYGTGCFLLANTGDTRVRSKNKLLSTVAWVLDGRVTYALEGSLFTAGAAIEWLVSGLGIIGSAAEVEELASSVADSGGVSLVPAFSGLGAPHWDPSARALMGGMTRGTGRAELCRAALEGVALQSYDLLKAFESDLGAAFQRLKVDGGGVENSLLMQMQADLADLKIERPECREQTAMGAAYLAGLAVGVWEDLSEIRKLAGSYDSFEPKIGESDREEQIRRWKKAVERSLDWA